VQRGAALHRNTFIDLNVLPAALRPHRYAGWYALGLAAVVFGCLLLVPTITVLHSASAQTGRLGGQLAAINDQLNAAEMTIGEERSLYLQINAAESAIAALKAERVALVGSARPVSQGLSALFPTAPPGLSIKSVAMSEGKITIAGGASSAAAVITYATALAQAGGFSDVTITSLTEPAGPGGPGTFEIQTTW